MKLRKTLTGILGVSMMALSVGSFSHVNEHKEVYAADSTTFDFKALTSDVDKTEIKTYTAGAITFAASKGSNTNNAPKYYTNGSAGRFYGGNNFVLKADEGYSITGVTFTFATGEGTNAITADKGTFNSSNWSGNTESVKFTIGGSSGHRRIAKLVVSYDVEKQLEACESPVIKCVDDQTGTYTWDAVEGAIGYSYTINDTTNESTNPVNVVLKDGETLKVFAKGDNVTTGDSLTSEAKYDAPYNIKVKNLVSNYYFEGSYVRDTKINLNEAAQNELVECFHAKVNMLERTTYFKPGELWMTNEVDTYSYYGTSEDGKHLTGGRVQNLGDTVTSIAEKNTGGMEGKYVTLTDIISHASSANWTLADGVYTSTNEQMIKDFLAFTAPCFLGLNGDKANYFTITGVSVKDNNGVLELKLLTSGDNGKFVEDANNVLSVAKISKYVEKNNDNLSEPVTITFDNKSKRTTFTASQQIWEENGLVITNNKASSSTPVADYANPARFYSGSELIIESSEGAFNFITIQCSSKDYATVFVNSIKGVEAKASDTTVTIKLSDPASSISCSLTGQVRVKSITCEYKA